MGKEIALFCKLHPRDQNKRDRALSLLRQGARDYYHDRKSQCTTWSYATPYPPPKSPSSSPPSLVGLEIYTDKQALTDQLNDKEFFQAFHQTAKREDLFVKEDELVAWYLSGGFVVRPGKGHEKVGGGLLVSVSEFLCKDRRFVLDLLSEFATWVHDNEPDVLTYAIFTRPKAPKEVLMYVRYRDRKALMGHSRAPEHVDVVKKMSTQLENDAGKSTTLWMEVEDSFVAGTLEDVPAAAKTSKL